jgi:hypothetical protein
VLGPGSSQQQQYGSQQYGVPQSSPYNQPYGAPQAPMGGGGSFLGTAAAAAAGVVGGSLLLGSIRSMMGGSHQSFADTSGSGETRNPWSADQSNSDLARDAGINDIGSGGHRADSSSAGLLDQASNDAPPDHDDDHDDMDLDSDDFGNDGGDSDYA